MICRQWQKGEAATEPTQVSIAHAAFGCGNRRVKGSSWRRPRTKEARDEGVVQ